MGISRDSRHKRSATGAKRAYYRKKRAFEKGRQPANTRIGTKRIHLVRTRGGNTKYRGLRLESGNFSWGSEGISRKVRVIGVSFHPSNNELVRTNTLTKSAVVQIDAAPFRQWYEAHYGQSLGRRRQAKTEKEGEETKKSQSVEKKQAARSAAAGKVDTALERQFEAGRLYAVVASRPGQSGRVDGYVLEGEELAFYQRAIRKACIHISLPANQIEDPVMSTNTVRTRLLIMSDTHTVSPLPSTDPTHAYRLPLPKADVLLHAGDITKVGYLVEYQAMFEMLKAAPAELKLVIPGNHDITLHEDFYVRGTGKNKHIRSMEDVQKIRELWTGYEARSAGIVYLEEGVRTFELGNGARFTLYSSPWQPEFYDWAFTYPRRVDRFNPSPAVVKGKAANPIPNHPAIDIMLTHGPPKDVLDETDKGEKVGCDHLLRAVTRCKPRLHCFGHIHEGWGAGRIDWRTEALEQVKIAKPRVFEDRCAFVDVSKVGGKPLQWGQETLFVNASIMDVRYRPTNAPWVVDIDLPMKQDSD
ncbi:40S ribosomal protein S8e [Usnea florida]